MAQFTVVNEYFGKTYTFTGNDGESSGAEFAEFCGSHVSAGFIKGFIEAYLGKFPSVINREETQYKNLKSAIERALNSN